MNSTEESTSATGYLKKILGRLEQELVGYSSDYDKFIARAEQARNDIERVKVSIDDIKQSLKVLNGDCVSGGISLWDKESGERIA